MGNYAGPQFEAVVGPKSGKSRFVLIALLVIAAIGFGGYRYNAHLKAVKQAQAADAAERQRLIKMADQIAQMKIALRETSGRVEAVAEANSKPTRKNGKAVPQEKWSQEQAAEYRMAQDNKILVSNALDKLVGEYNSRRAAYTGKWPKGGEPPSVLTGSKK